MPHPLEVTRTEQRIAEVDALRKTIQQLKKELLAYSAALRQELQWLRQDQELPEDPVADEDSPEPAEALADPEDVFTEEVEEVPEPPPPPRRATPPPVQPAHRAVTPPRTPAPAAARLPALEPPMSDEPSKTGKPVSVIITHGQDSNEPLSGWVVDRPSGGLRILVDEQIPIGSVLSVRPTKEHPNSQWVNVSVKNCRPERNSFILGCSFVERPPWTVLALFAG